MEGLTINVGWEYFLGVMAAIVGIAWYTSARFTALETSMKWVEKTLGRFATLETSIKWVEKTLGELKISSDNEKTPAFGADSPINLNERGREWLTESGLKEYIENHQDKLLEVCHEKDQTNPYEVQEHIFNLFNGLSLDAEFEENLKKFAFEKGTTLNILRRIGALYFRDICLKKFNMNTEDIDLHDPQKNS